MPGADTPSGRPGAMPVVTAVTLVYRNDRLTREVAAWCA